jgi:hypothetical protein
MIHTVQDASADDRASMQHFDQRSAHTGLQDHFPRLDIDERGMAALRVRQVHRVVEPVDRRGVSSDPKRQAEFLDLAQLVACGFSRRESLLDGGPITR